MSACIHMARRGGRIIAEEHTKGLLGAHNKKAVGDSRNVVDMAANEVLTVADGRAQHAIVTSLRGMFPGLRLVGEEGEVTGEEQATKLADVSLIQHDFNVPLELRESLTTDDTCLWIDPLDGTKEFVLGNLENVSVLIGIAVRDRPVGGVILQPFVGEGDGNVTYGAIGVGVFHNGEKVVVDAPSETVIVMTPHSISDGGRLCTALGRIVPKPRVIPLNACGNKMLRVIRGEASAHLQGPGASRWDTCAGEALLKAAGGLVTTLDGVEYQYKEGACYDNADGSIAARTPEIHAQMLQALRGEGPLEKKLRGVE